jgi:predicted Zn finger-like uncharacterized protein
MITRCPECSTLFKVVADQLRISEGWVRCGQCGAEFDGAANLQPEPELEPQRQTEPELQLRPEALQDVAPPAEAEPVAQATQATPVSSAFAIPATLDDWAPDLPPASPPAESPPDVSFVHAAQRQAQGMRPWLRGLLAFCCLALSLALALQIVVQERDRIGAAVPQALPGLQALCQLLGCRIEPFKDPNAITIDTSSFSPVTGDVYRLQVTLKNTGSRDIAMPAIELTLTDTADALVLRRVFLPKDFAADKLLLAAGGEWSAALTVSVALTSGGSRIAGYRVLAFYP